MRVSLTPFAIFATITGCVTAASWTFKDAQLALTRKGVEGTLLKEQISPSRALPQPVSLGPQDTLKLSLTAALDSKASRPHQAYLVLQDVERGLAESFPLSISAAGTGKIDIAQKDIPAALTESETPLQASLVLGSFGSSTPYTANTFSLALARDQAAPAPGAPTRYGRLNEIHHIFKASPKSPPVFITAVFSMVVFAMLPVLIGTWLTSGGNFNHLPEAVSNAPISYAFFIGSVLAMEGVFFLYYINWTLFQILPVATAVAATAFTSGTRALSEVQSRRLAGKR